MRTGKSLAAIAAVMFLVSFAGCGPEEAEGECGLRSTESIASAAQALPTDGQVCLTVQRGAAGVADANLWASSPTWIDSASTRLTSGSSATAGRRRALVRDDLSAVPAGATVLSAKFSLYQLYRTTGGTSVSLFRVTAPWNESSVTWNAFNNAFDPAPLGSFTTLTTTNGWRTVDIAPLAQAWVDGTLPNHGVLLDEDASTYTEYRSSESASTSERPKLELCYVTCSDGLQNGAETGVDCGGPRCAPCPGSSGAALWSKRFGDDNSQVGTAIAADDAGNSILMGTLSGSVDFGGGPVTSSPIEDVFLAKFDAAGHHVWSNHFGDPGWSNPSGMAVDSSGNVVVAGDFAWSIDFGGGPLVSTSGSANAFVAKFDAAGHHVWSQHFSEQGRSSAFDVAVDSDGNVVLTGAFAGSVDFGGGLLVTSSGTPNVFLVKFDAAGHHLWSKSFGDPGLSYGLGVAVDSGGDVVLTGDFYGSIDFGGGPLTSESDRNVFVAKFDAAGDPLWSKSFSDTAWSSVVGVAVDSGGEMVLAGNFSGSIDLGGGPLTNAGDANKIFVAKLDAAGDHLWSERFGSTGNSAAVGVAMTGAGDVALTGSFIGTVDFGNGPLTNTGTREQGFVAKLDPAGHPLWSRSFGVPNASYSNSSSRSVAMDGAGDVVLTGSFTGTVDFGNGPLTTASQSWPDVFLAKFAP